MMVKVTITDHGFPSVELERGILESAGFQLEEIRPICKTEEDVIRNCRDATLLMVQWAPITKRVLDALSGVRGVVRYGIGVDNIDIEEARARGVMVANVPGYCVEEVSDHALAMIVSLARRIPQDHRQILLGGWGINRFRPIPALSDLILGLVGLGSIARRVAEKGRAFGFRFLAFDPFVPDAVFERYALGRVDWETLLASADVISLHCPLVPETMHLIDRAAIGRMKPGVLLINTARGPLIKEADLIEALRTGRIGGAGLDVFEKEPLHPDCPLRNFDNVILTSHSASVSERAVRLLQIKAAEAARDFLQGKRPASVL